MARVSEEFLLLQSGYLFPEVARRIRAWQEKNPGEDVLRLSIGNTTEAITPVIAEAMHHEIDLLSDRKTYTGYGDEQGNTELREAIAAHYRNEYGVDLPVSSFFISDGAKSDAANIQSIFSRSSIPAVQDPSYPVYVDSSPPKEHADIIYLCFPNNPTGAVATKEQLKAFVDYAHREKAVIIFDSAYSDYISTPGIPHSIYEIEGAEDCAIEIGSFSKNAGFTGVRLGWSIVPEALESDNAPRGTFHRIWNRRQCTFFNGASNISQAGGLAALSEAGRKECMSLVNYYKGNAAIIAEGIKSLGMESYGGVDSPYIWLRCPDGLSSWEFFDLLLEKAHVAVTPGSGFGHCGEGFVRISSYGHREDIERAVEALKEKL